MDTRLARTIYTLKIAAKLKKNNPELSDEFIKKNNTYFPNKTDTLVEFKKGTVGSTVTSEGFSNPAKNLELKKSKIAKILAKKEFMKAKSDQLNSFVSLNYEQQQVGTQQGGQQGAYQGVQQGTYQGGYQGVQQGVQRTSQQFPQQGTRQPVKIELQDPPKYTGVQRRL